MSIKVTDNVFRKVEELIKQANNPGELALRVSVDGGGCSGFMYNYELISISTVQEDDYIIKQGDNAVVIDAISQQSMKECIIDFVEELGNSYFEVKNPNAKAKCGCGNSFAL